MRLLDKIMILQVIKKTTPLPPTHTNTKKKRGTQLRGRGGGGQHQNFHWGIRFCPKMMILQGVGHLIPYLVLCYANDPKRGGHKAPAPALDLRNLFEVICPTILDPPNMFGCFL